MNSGSANTNVENALITVPKYRDWMALIVHLAVPGFVLGLTIAAVFVTPYLPFGILLALVLGVFYGWLLYAFLHYRQGRQDEFLHLLTTTVESRAPLAPVLRAYLADRPHGPLREAWLALLLFPLLPGYYWLWYRERCYDRKVEAVAFLLEQGTSLPYALRAVPGVAPRESLLAAALGQATGKLALCLRNSAHSKLATLWLEVLPRFLYPFFVLLAVLNVTGFWVVIILPRMQRVLLDFGQELPTLTRLLFQHFHAIAWDIGLALAVILALAVPVLISSTARWHFPVLGRMYRRYSQGQVLKMLGVLLEADKPVPEALDLLVASGYFSRVVVRRLRKSRRRIEQGEPLVDGLRRGRLLPRHMAPLVHAAERARSLPWALAEIGETLTDRTIRLMRRISLAAFPTLVFATGLLVGFIVLGMFMPLINIIGSLSP